MTIPTVVMHSGQNMYVFNGLVEDDGGLLAKFSCMYCGSGDYILSRLPEIGFLSLQAETELSSESFISPAVCCEEDVPAAVPEPSGFFLLMAGIILIFCGHRLMRRWRTRSNRVGVHMRSSLQSSLDEPTCAPSHVLAEYALSNWLAAGYSSVVISEVSHDACHVSPEGPSATNENRVMTLRLQRDTDEEILSLFSSLLRGMREVWVTTVGIDGMPMRLRLAGGGCMPLD